MISKIILPNRLRTIGERAFSGNTFTCVIIPEGCACIDAYAFSDCPQLRFVEIPASVENIDIAAFSGHSEDLVIITSTGSTAERFASNNGIICVIP